VSISEEFSGEGAKVVKIQTKSTEKMISSKSRESRRWGGVEVGQVTRDAAWAVKE